MREPLVTVWPDRYVVGWTGSGDAGVLCPTVPLREALSTEYATDAHFVPYHVPGEAAIPRLALSALPVIQAAGADVVFDLVVFDLDDAAAHEAGTEARDAWRDGIDRAFESLPEELYFALGRYDTRGGCRLWAVLETPCAVEAYLATLAHYRGVLGALGLVCDPLVDWTRSYRLPRVTREGVGVESRAVGPWPDRPLAVAAASPHPLRDLAKARKGFALAPEITERRNVTLARLAGSLRRSGLTPDEIFASLSATNLARCRPPLGQDEVAKIAASVGRYEAPAPPPLPSRIPEAAEGPCPVVFDLGSELEIAEHVARGLEPADVPWAADERGVLWEYQAPRGVWREVDVARVHRAVAALDGAPVANGRDKKGQPAYRPLKVGAQLLANVAIVCSRVRADREFFATAADGLALESGFVRVEGADWRLDPHNPAHRATVALPYDYTPGGNPARWLATLASCFRDDPDAESKIQTLREWVGAMLLGLAPRFAKGLILLGGGANGKSTVQDVVVGLLPRDAVASVNPQEMHQEYARAQLRHKKLNCVAELPEQEILSAEAIKAMISGDEVEGRRAYENRVRFRPTAGHLFSANALPGVRDMSRGFWRRWVLVQFGREIPESEQVRGLAETVLREERGEVASWALDGARSLLARGHFATSAGMDRDLAAWRDQADQVSRFLAEATVPCDPGDGTLSTVLFSAYSAWARRVRTGELGAHKFYSRLRALGISENRTKMGVVFCAKLAQGFGVRAI